MGCRDGARVEPADEEIEGLDVVVWEAVGFGGRVFVVEGGGEEGGVVAEQFFVQVVGDAVGADVNVDHGVREKSVSRRVSFISEGFGWAGKLISIIYRDVRWQRKI